VYKSIDKNNGDYVDVDENDDHGDPRTYIIKSVLGFNYLDFSPNINEIDLSTQNKFIKVIKKDESLKHLFNEF